jgi:hypothetical protein
MIRTDHTKNCSNRRATDRTTGALPLLLPSPRQARGKATAVRVQHTALASHALRNEGCQEYHNEYLILLSLVKGGGKNII